MVNPPDPGKYDHWINEAMPENAEQWMSGSTQMKGSWWLDWDNWLAPKSGVKIAAPKELGSSDYPPLEDAPGSYVKVRLEKHIDRDHPIMGAGQSEVS